MVFSNENVFYEVKYGTNMIAIVYINDKYNVCCLIWDYGKITGMDRDEYFNFSEYYATNERDIEKVIMEFDNIKSIRGLKNLNEWYNSVVGYLYGDYMIPYEDYQFISDKCENDDV